ncbi:hypothetical protein JTE90_007696 [Oedothorax gibbosus]|uniref:Uncharacterized protein n=1 Tax=Oedothorax gibbosus TaxID=931172 RepID=A0AAV6TVZ7_9ARAC|nr:hypothetical protein JTE90_007696 [Oedothorax gibbosus]
MTEPTPMVAAIRISQYNHGDPALWFQMCEATFELDSEGSSHRPERRVRPSGDPPATTRRTHRGPDTNRTSSRHETPRAAHQVPDKLMLELFLQHLPSHVQTVLAAVTPLTLDKGAEIADIVMEVSPIAQKPDKCSPRQLRHLDYISQFTTDIRHTKGSDNQVADAFSRIEIDSISSSPLNFEEFARVQATI